jgi:hypothetical protein
MRIGWGFLHSKISMVFNNRKEPAHPEQALLFIKSATTFLSRSLPCLAAVAFFQLLLSDISRLSSSPELLFSSSALIIMRRDGFAYQRSLPRVYLPGLFIFPARTSQM